jgi:hypothetical protein
MSSRACHETIATQSISIELHQNTIAMKTLEARQTPMVRAVITIPSCYLLILKDLQGNQRAGVFEVAQNPNCKRHRNADIVMAWDIIREHVESFCKHLKRLKTKVNAKWVGGGKAAGHGGHGIFLVL